MKTRFFFLALGLFPLATLSSFSQNTTNPVVRMNTTLGNIDVTLRADVAPKTVANFFNYVNNGLYTNSLIHRSVTVATAGVGVFQGGGYVLQTSNINSISTYPPVISEANLSNTVGTLAMALSSGANSGTSQWYFNVIDNSMALDGSANGGPFTVFGQVANPASLTVMNQVAAVPVPAPSPFNPPLNQIPLINYTTGGVTLQNLVLLNYVTQLNPPIFFQNGASLGILTLNNSTLLPSAWAGTGTMGSGWQERAIGDVNGDGVPDLIFQNGTIIGALILDDFGNPSSWVGIGSMNAGWILCGAAHLTQDGNLDLIFQNGTLLGYLEINSSAQPVSWNGIGAMGAGWQLRAVASLDGTGRPNLIFQNGTSLGALQVGTNGLPTAWNGIGAMASGWTLSFAVDVNGDGQPDLLFQNGALLGALTVNTSFKPVGWYGIGAMGSGWTLPGDY